MKENTKGITLIALMVTIVVLLILAGISIGILTGDNGIIKQATEAKNETEIAEEKEIIGRATVQAAGNNRYGNIEENELQNALDSEIGEGKGEVADIGEEFEIIFKETNRVYTVDKNGNVTDTKEVIEDKNPGDITVGKNGEELDGSEEKPYEIWCIEDLVVLSNMSRGKGNCKDNGETVTATANTFSGKKIVLMRDLNFNSKASYSDLSMRWSYDEENNVYIIDESSTENLRDLITDRNKVGFIPISEDTGSGYLMFAGYFDGQNYEIRNLYENRVDAAGLFYSVYHATIKNLKLINVNITSDNRAYGITQKSQTSKFYNIYVSGNITGKTVGGIVHHAMGDVELINCYNTAILTASQSVGGLIRFDDTGGTTTIVNCYNGGQINSTSNYNR